MAESTCMDLSLCKSEPLEGDELYIDLTKYTDEEFFRLLSKRMDACWEPVATSLEIKNEQIICIKNEFLDPDEQIFQMFMTVNKNLIAEQNVRKKIAKALWENGRKDLASELSSGKLKKLEEPVQATCTQRGKPYGYPEIGEKTMRKLAEKLPGDMEKLATELGVTNEQVGKIKDKYRKVNEQTFQMLLKWQKNTPGGNHRELLISALEKIGRRDVAFKLQSDTL